MLEDPVFDPQLGVVDALTDEQTQFCHVNGFGDVVPGTPTYRFYSGLDGAIGGHDDQDRLQAPLSEKAQQIQTAHLPHHQIGDHGIN